MGPRWLLCDDRLVISIFPRQGTAIDHRRCDALPSRSPQTVPLKICVLNVLINQIPARGSVYTRRDLLLHVLWKAPPDWMSFLQQFFFQNERIHERISKPRGAFTQPPLKNQCGPLYSVFDHTWLLSWSLENGLPYWGNDYSVAIMQSGRERVGCCCCCCCSANKMYVLQQSSFDVL